MAEAGKVWTRGARVLPDPDGPARAVHVDRIADEFFGGFDAVADIVRPAVSIFGSARIGEAHPYYARASSSGGSSPTPASRSSPAAARA